MTFRRTLSAAMAIFIAVLGAGCAGRAHWTDLPTHLSDSLWIRPIQMDTENALIYEGFALSGNGELRLVGIFSMTGESWRVENDVLILGTRTERYEEAGEMRLHGEVRQGVSVLVLGEGPEAPVFTRWESPSKIPLGQWAVAVLPNPEGFPLSTDPAPYISVEVDGYLHGFGGVNGFGGPLNTQDGSWSTGPFIGTLMAGPYLDSELLIQQSLQESESWILAADELTLFKGQTPLLVLRLTE